MAETEAAEPPVADASPPTQPRADHKWRIFAIAGVLSLVADQVTKIWARASLPVTPKGCAVPADFMTGHCHGDNVSVLGSFWDWRLSMNPGSAFGLFANNQAFARVALSLVGIGAVVGMVYMLYKARWDQRVLHWALALVAGGAVGNLIDRIYYGVVTDFVLLHYGSHEWPVFNVADIVLVVGVGLMFIDIQKENKRDKARKQIRLEKAKAAGLVKM